MSRSQFKVLRVEETPTATGSETAAAVATEAIRATPTSKPVAVDDVEHWKRLAIQTGDRLSIAEEQAKALRVAADEARARFGKYKDRLDKAQERVNEQQVEIVRLNAERETWKAEREMWRARVAERDAQLLSQADLAREFHACREKMREWVEKGPMWDLFVKLAVSPPSAGEENR